MPSLSKEARKQKTRRLFAGGSTFRNYLTARVNQGAGLAGMSAAVNGVALALGERL